MLKNWRRNVDKTYALRDLTIEEAILGLPGYLSSLNLKTSPGYPVSKMINSMGKTGCFKIKPGGEVEIEPWFRTAVQQRLDEMKRGVTPNNRFVVYWKDELVSPSKIEEARTRAIYCNDVISLVAFRIKFGILLARINNSSNATPSAIGMNQYSTDMDNIYSYLTSTGNKRFVAGDYKNYISVIMFNSNELPMKFSLNYRNKMKTIANIYGNMKLLILNYNLNRS